MATLSSPNASSIRIKFDHGPDLEGNNVYKTKTLSGVKSDATNEDIMAVVNSIAGLQSHKLNATNRIDNSSLSE